MNKTQKKMIRILIEKKTSWVSSTYLSNLLNISDRQIRRHISEINNLLPNFIRSSYQGYQINELLINQYEEFCLTQDQEMLSPKKRRDAIIRYLIDQEKINIFDLSEELYVSDSTVENDIKKINTKLNEYDLEIAFKKNHLIFSGSEINKRKFIASQSENYIKNFNLKSEVELLANYYNYGFLFPQIKDILSSFGIFANDYAISNILLHVIIMIERLQNDNLLTQHIPNQEYKNTNPYFAAIKIINVLKDSYDLKHNEAEIFQLTLVIDNNTSLLDFSMINRDNISSFIPYEIIHLTNDILNALNDRYSFKPNNSEIIIKFTIHIYNLISRYKLKNYINHPFKDDLKMKHPYIYDIAVYIAQILNERHQIEINEDEIAFIAIHIGGALQEEMERKDKVKVALIYSEYYDNYKNILNQIKKNFDRDLVIQQVLPFKKIDSISNDIQLVLTTDKISQIKNSLYIGQFLTKNIKNDIYQAIQDLNKLHKYSKLNLLINRFIKEELFFYNLNLNNKYEIISYICNKAVENSYAKQGFLEDVMVRENLSSTDFSFVAIPHSLSLKANETFISIYINQEKITWGNSSIRLVLLIGVNQNEIEDFAYIYDSLVEILQNEVKILELLSEDSREKFINKLSELS